MDWISKKNILIVGLGLMGGSYANDMWYARHSCYFGVAEDGAWNAGYRIVVDAVVK